MELPLVRGSITVEGRRDNVAARRVDVDAFPRSDSNAVSHIYFDELLGVEVRIADISNDRWHWLAVSLA
jgi:hypothetical protein